MRAQVCPTSYGATGTSSRGTAITSGSGVGTFSTAFTQLASSTDTDACALIVSMIAQSTALFQVKLYVGAASSETEFAHIPGPVNALGSMSLLVPIGVPAGSRITAKCCDSGGGGTMNVHVTLVRGSVGQSGVSRGSLVGVASNDFTDVDAGATINTKGAWTQIVASTTYDAKGYTLALLGDPSNETNMNYLLDLAVGAAASEQIILADVQGNIEAYRGDSRPNIVGPIWTPIPAASRIAARVQSSTNGAADRIPKVGIVLWE